MDITTLTPIVPSTVGVVTPGYKTSEFWMKLLATLLTAFYASGVIPTSGTTSQVVAIVATMLGALGYTVVRGAVKTAAQKSLSASVTNPADSVSANTNPASGVSTSK